MGHDYVLVADAAPDLERQVREQLAGSTLKVRAASDGLAAHTILADYGPPALLVTNLSLPKRDGFALVRGLRRVDPQRVVPAAIVSSIPKFLDDAEKMHAELSPITILSKPLPPNTIPRLLHERETTALPRPQAKTSRPPEMTRPRSEMPAASDAARVRRIEESGIVDDGEPEPELQAMIGRVAEEFGVPIALVSLVLGERQWFKSYHGIRGRLLLERGTPRDWSFCQHVVEGRAPLVVPDAREHPLFAMNPLVRDGSVTGYAGVPISTSSGDVLGTLCIIDQRPLDIGAADLERLTKAARRIAGELEVASLRKRSPSTGLEAEQAKAAFPYLEATLQALDVGVILFNANRTVVLANPAIRTLFGVAPHAIFGKTRDETTGALATSFAFPEEDLQRLQVSTTGPWLLDERIILSRPDARVVRWLGRPVLLPDGIGQMITMSTISQ